MAHIESIRPLRDNGTTKEFKVYYAGLKGYTSSMEIFATDELDAYSKVRKILEDKEMTDRWMVVAAAAFCTILVLATATCTAIESTAAEKTEQERISACLNAGKSYASNSNGFVCADRPRFPVDTVNATSGQAN